MKSDTLTPQASTIVSYTLPAIILHWLTALLIAGGFVLGLYMVTLALSPHKLRLFSYHKWIGVTVFIFAVARLIWRNRHPAPPLPERMPGWEKRAAGYAHYGLYSLMLIVPLTGWLLSSADGFKTVYLKIIPLPDLIAKDKEAAEFLEGVHFILNKTLAALVFLHAAAAIKHHFIDRDDVLTRMLGRSAR